MSITTLLEEAYEADALRLTNEQLDDPMDMLVEALAESVDLPTDSLPSFDKDLEGYQFHNQDRISHIDNDVIDDMHPDSDYHHHSAPGVETTGNHTVTMKRTMLEELLEGSEEVSSDEADTSDEDSSFQEWNDDY